MTPPPMLAATAWAGVGQHLADSVRKLSAMRHHWSMTFPEWSEPVRLMEQKVGPVTEGQLTLGTEVGLSLVSDLPRGVAAEMLEEHLRPTIWAELKREPALATEKQLAFLEKIADVKPWKHVTLSRRVASAWIDYYLTVRNVEFLRKLKLRSGDKVARTEAWVDSLTGEIQTFTNDNVVSSIGASGLVYFKGGNGKCAWPSALSRVTDA